MTEHDRVAVTRRIIASRAICHDMTLDQARELGHDIRGALINAGGSIEDIHQTARELIDLTLLAAELNDRDKFRAVAALEDGFGIEAHPPTDDESGYTITERRGN